MTRNILISCFLHLFLFSGAYQTQAVEYKYPSNSKVLFYAPGFSTPDDLQDAITRDGQEFFNNAVHFNADVTPLRDRAASVEAVKSFGDYGTVILHTHGWYWTYPWEDDQEESNLNYSCFRTGSLVQFPVEPSSSYANELANHRLVVSKSPNTQGDYHYVVTPAYIKKHLAANALDGAFFFLGVCASFKDNQFLHFGMWDALESKGAKVGFGYSDYVTRSHNVDMFTQLMSAEGMLPGDRTVPAKTVAQAYTNISDTTDAGYHLRAEFEKEVASAEWNNFVFDKPDLLRIRLTYYSADYSQVNFYSCYWNMNTDSEFEVKDIQTGDILPQPIHDSLITSTNIAGMTWNLDITTDQSYPQFVSDLINVSWLDDSQRGYPSFLATSAHWPGEINRSSMTTELPSDYCSRNGYYINESYSTTLQNFLMAGGHHTQQPSIYETGDMGGYLPPQLHFKNSPPIGIATEIASVSMPAFICGSDCVGINSNHAQGVFQIFNDTYTTSYFRETYSSSSFVIDSHLKMEGNNYKLSFVDTDTIKADIIYIPHFSYDSGFRTEEDICNSIHYPFNPLPSFKTADSDYSHLQIISGYSSKRDVLMREANATEDNWDEYKYATANGTLSAWLKENILSLAPNPEGVLDLPYAINCSTNIK